jgi:hypothetical protein
LGANPESQISGTVAPKLNIVYITSFPDPGAYGLTYACTAPPLFIYNGTLNPIFAPPVEVEE